MSEPVGLTYEEAAAIVDPVECAKRITEYGRTRGNLPRRLAVLRVMRLIEARTKEGRKVTWLAAKVGLAPSGISRLTKTALAEGASS